MEAQLNFPKWQAKFDKSFPNEIIGINKDVSKSETSESNSKTECVNTWLVVGAVAVVGIILYFIWKLDKDEKKQKTEC